MPQSINLTPPLLRLVTIDLEAGKKDHKVVLSLDSMIKNYQAVHVNDSLKQVGTETSLEKNTEGWNNCIALSAKKDQKITNKNRTIAGETVLIIILTLLSFHK